MMERHFDEELEKMNTDLLKMASLTEEAIYKAIESLKQQDTSAAQQVIDEDNAIDKLELSIDESGIGLLALRQPIARDLRFITTGLKINTELERIADLAVNIAERVFTLSKEPLLKPLIDIPKLTEVARKMVKDTIDAFVNRDQNKAKQVILSDSKADELRNLISDELITEYMIKDSDTVTKAIPLFLVARHLERICDHATYIAEDVVYMVKAEIVKHHPEKLQ
jgi:phosphate transport system protein